VPVTVRTADALELRFVRLHLAERIPHRHVHAEMIAATSRTGKSGLH
jgi:hypothetical protein